MLNSTIFIFASLLVALVTGQTVMTPGQSYEENTDNGKWTYFTLKLSESTINYVQLSANIKYGYPLFYANINSEPTFENNIWKYENQTKGPTSMFILHPNVDMKTGAVKKGTLYLGIYGYQSTAYSIESYTQGPYQLHDKQVQTPDQYIYDTYTFYKFKINPQVLSFQIAVNAKNFFYTQLVMSNSTSTYPVADGKYQYRGDYCIKINNPYPGNYRVGLQTKGSAGFYKIQYVENTLGSCGIEM